MNREKKATVLIVEDNPLTLQTLIECLQKLDVNTSVAHNGEEALRQVGDVKPDLILLDIMLPGIDGFEVCLRLKTILATKDIPVIFLTALSDTADKVKAYEVGGVDYITKPFDFQEVAIRVNTRLTIQKLQRQLQAKRSFITTGEEELKSEEKATILIVDDDVYVLEALRVYLTGFDFRILPVQSGEEALQQVQQTLPDLILLDIIMPDMDGFETCRELKNNPRTKDIPVIFMTALSDMPDKVKAYEAGGADYIMKPHHYAEVISRINAHLTIQTLRRQLRKYTS